MEKKQQPIPFGQINKKIRIFGVTKQRNVQLIRMELQ